VSDTHRGDILIVDDTPANLQVLWAMLKEEGYKVRPVPNGRLAIRAVEQSPPDLILLDINMPEMDGYETCRALKANPDTAGVRVVFLSARTDVGDKVKAFEAGGVDYMSKPFEFHEVMSRVETHLRIVHLERELAECRGS
jgi:DNA-binding response OmpR family regulator